ncbi:MAG TPA: PAS domain S-box protein [Polyangiaceae bacterium]|nr:PAS domain S-box protein [Polyangiaceae bacterium]
MHPTRPTEQDAAFLRELETLRVGEAEFSLILGDIQDHAVSLLDADGAIVTWNATAERIKGYTLDEVRGKHFRLLFTERDQNAGMPETELRIAKETGKYQGDAQRLRKDGTLFIANVSLSALRDEQGVLRGFVKVTHDITARVRAQNQLETSSEASAALTSLLDEPAMLAAFTRALVKRYADCSAVDFIDEKRKLRYGELSHVNPLVESALRQKRARSLPHLTTHPVARVMDGSGCIVEDPGELLRGANLDLDGELQSALILPLIARGSVFGALALGSRSRKNYDASDLSLGIELARRLALALDNARLFERARAGEQRLAVALEAGKMGAWEWEIAANHVTWSPLLEDIHGIPRGSFRGTFEGHRDDMHPDDVERVSATLERTLRTGEPYFVQYRIIRPDGQVRWLEARANLLHDAEGRPLRLVGVCTDVSERKRAQDDLAENERRLGRLYESEQEARKSADLANKAKDDFLAIVSHELRTPLNAMLGWTRLLRSGTLPPDKQSHALETIERNAVTQAELVEDLLDVSRIVSGKLSLEMGAFDLRALVEEAIDSLRPACAAKEIAIATALDAPPCRLHGDEKRLRQVVWNLLTNAIKFSESGGQIRVGLEHSPEELHLTVSDSGRGIEHELLPHVFDRFTQADGVTTRAHGGLGLGLAISKHIVGLHGGTIEVESEGLGRGATFRVRLPVSAQALASAHESPVSERQTRAVHQELAGLHVLVVDDDQDGRELLVTLLENSGAQVTSAENASDALHAIRQSTPHVLLSDIGMPGTDGYQLMRSIRALSPHPSARVPAAALTGFGRTEDRREALAAGFLMHLAKPLDPAEVIAVVLKLAHSSLHVSPRRDSP